MPRLWYPSCLIDEVMPPGRESPEAWLRFLDNQIGWEDGILARLYHRGDEIDFKWVERLGPTTLTISPDGTLATPMRCPRTLDLFGRDPEDEPLSLASANDFWDWETEIFATRAEDFAALYADAVGPFFDEQPQEVRVEVSRWSDTLRYRISDDGRSLIPLPPQQSPAAEA